MAAQKRFGLGRSGLTRGQASPYNFAALGSGFVADFPEHGGSRHLLHFGTAYKLGRLHQLDLHVGAGLSRAAVDRFIGAGYSFRFQARQK
jgi:Putative MetA-pathway of phenol degradation